MSWLIRLREQLQCRLFSSLRFRAKISLGFAAVLGISAASMAIAYIGLERISAGVALYRSSVSESDLARNIDRELISYQSLARYYVVTGKEEDAKAAVSAEKILNEAIDLSTKVTTTPERLDKITRLSSEFRVFTEIFAQLLAVKRESASLAENQLTSGATILRFKLEDLADSASNESAAATKELTAQFLAATALVNSFLTRPYRTLVDSVMTRLKFLETTLATVKANDDRATPKVIEISGLLDKYRQSFEKLVENSKSIDRLTAEMAKSASKITQISNDVKATLLADQHRLENESDAIVRESERLVALLAIGGFVLGGLLTWLMGKGISRPMTAMCSAMRELAEGNFGVVLPGLGRRDELGEMAGAVEAFKMQAIARAKAEVDAQEAQSRAIGDARQAELIRFADRFEATVGAIVSNVSASAVQLESAAGTLTRTAETTQNLSGRVASASENAACNMQSIAAATEELSLSVNEIGRQAHESNLIADAAVIQAQQTDTRIVKLSRAAQQIGDVLKLITAIAEQTNLLALNATIEAARAGDAGRGFAVVASEVKSLASQTANATEEISSHISAMQAATQESVAAIKDITDTIGQISNIVSTIAVAVEQQSSATQEIAQSVQSVAQGTQEAVNDITQVNRGATETGSASEDVLNSAQTLSAESARLRQELDRFMASVRAA